MLLLQRADQPDDRKDRSKGTINMDVARADHDGLWHNLPRREQMCCHHELLEKMTSPVLPHWALSLLLPQLLCGGSLLHAGRLRLKDSQRVSVKRRDDLALALFSTW